MRAPLPLLSAASLAMAACSGLTASSGSKQPEDPESAYADSVFYAKVITLEEAKGERKAEAVAVRRGVIVYVGDKAGAKEWVDEDTQAFDWGDHTLFPGFTDAHGHLAGLGRALSSLDLSDAESYGELLLRVQSHAKGGKETWIVGRGWDQNRWPVTEFPTATALDAIISDRPVVLSRIDGHALLANSRALEAAGIGPNTESPKGGRIVLDPVTGLPTGVLVDNAMSLVRAKIPPPSAGELRRWVQAAVAHLVKQGVTEIHDAGTSEDDLAAFESLAQLGELRVRVYAMLDASSEAGRQQLQWDPRVGLYDHFLSVRAVKLMVDGALGSRGAWLTQPYTDDPKNKGNPVTSTGELMALARMAHNRGYQVAVHAIGDAGVRTVLDVFEAIFSRDIARKRNPRGRIEHAQVIDPDDHMRMSAMKVIASMQPVHATSDMPWAEKRLGPRRIRWAYAWRTLSDNGIPLAFGSDFPVEPPSPLQGIYAAATRQDADGQPKGGWTPKERIKVEEAVRAYTVGAAWAAFEEERRGTIKLGKLADFTLLNRNILDDDPADVRKARVLATVVGGRVEYQADDL